MIKIVDVAKRAGVSKGTVSKVLKDYKNISQDTRKKVLKAVKDLNFIPNKNASSLSSKNSNRIGIYLNINDKQQSIDEINMNLLLGSFKAGKELKYDLITIFESTIEGLEKEELVFYLKSLGLAGLVIFGINKNDKKIAYLIERNIFKIVVTDAVIFNDDTSCVLIDHEEAQYDVAKKTIRDIGGKILYLAGKKNGYVTDLRNKGMQKLIAETNLKCDFINADFSENKAYEIVLKNAKKYDYLICASDLMAIGAFKALKKLNIIKPISGFDGIKLLSYLEADIITVSQDFYLQGYLAIKEISRLLKGLKGRWKKYEYHLIEYK